MGSTRSVEASRARGCAQGSRVICPGYLPISSGPNAPDIRIGPNAPDICLRLCLCCGKQTCKHRRGSRNHIHQQHAAACALFGPRRGRQTRRSFSTPIEGTIQQKVKFPGIIFDTFLALLFHGHKNGGIVGIQLRDETHTLMGSSRVWQFFVNKKWVHWAPLLWLPRKGQNLTWAEITFASVPCPQNPPGDYVPIAVPIIPGALRLGLRQMQYNPTCKTEKHTGSGRKSFPLTPFRLFRLPFICRF